MQQRILDFTLGVALCTCLWGYRQDRHGSLDAYVVHLRAGHWTQVPADEWITKAITSLLVALILSGVMKWLRPGR